MAQTRRASMTHPRVEDLLARVDSKFTLVTLSARRARQITSYHNQLSEGLGSLIPPQVASTARKPLSIALEEIAADKIVLTRPDPSAADETSDDSTEAGDGEAPGGLTLTD